VKGENIVKAFPITNVNEIKDEWTTDELVTHESQTYPCYLVYVKPNEEPNKSV